MMPMIWLFVLLLAVTAFFNLAEMALVAVRASTLAASDDPLAKRALVLKQRPGLFLAAIRAGDLLTDLLTGAFVVTTLEATLRGPLSGMPAVGGGAGAIASIGAFAIVSFLILVLGDLVPKSVALNAPERWTLLVTTPLRLFIVAAHPFFLLLERSNALVLRLFGLKPDHMAGVTQAEIRRTLAEGLSTGALLGTERSMMERVLDLEHRSVRTVMTGRRYVQTLREDASAEAIRLAALESGATLVLVTSMTNGEPVGVAKRADILAALTQGTLDFPSLILPVPYVVESASALGVLDALKVAPAGLGVVVDEFGSMLGIVTFADILEAIAGDIAIADPAGHEDVAGAFQCEPDGVLILPGGQPIDDLAEALHLPLPASRRFKTVAGMVIDRSRRLPEPGEIFAFEGFDVEIVAVDRGTIRSVRIMVHAPETRE